MRLLRIQQAASLLVCTSAYITRDVPINQTTTAPWDRKSTQTTWNVTHTELDTEKPGLRPRPSEDRVDGFETTWFEGRTSIEQRVAESKATTSSMPDVGSLIESLLNTAKPPLRSSAAIHFERSEDGWGELTPSAAVPSDVQYPPPFLEVPGGDFNSAITGGLPPNHMPQATPLAGMPQITNPGVALVPQVTPPPAITYSGITLRPVPVTSVRVLTIDGKATTVSSVIDYRYVVGTATLPIGSPTTINNVVVAMSIDSSGSTILVAGDQTTTLPPPAGRPQQVQATSILQAVKIFTTVVQGTTKYVLDGQTLAPGQAITVNGIPISLVVQSQSTILIVGTMTTNLGGVPQATTTNEWGASAAATFGGGRGNGNQQSAVTSSYVGAGHSRMTSWLLTDLLGLSALVRLFV